MLSSMFNNDLDELISFFRENVEEKKEEVKEETVENKKKLQEYINRIRRVRVSRVNRKRSSPMMIS